MKYLCVVLSNLEAWTSENYLKHISEISDALRDNKEVKSRRSFTPITQKKELASKPTFCCITQWEDGKDIGEVETKGENFSEQEPVLAFFILSFVGVGRQLAAIPWTACYLISTGTACNWEQGKDNSL